MEEDPYKAPVEAGTRPERRAPLISKQDVVAIVSGALVPPIPAIIFLADGPHPGIRG